MIKLEDMQQMSMKRGDVLVLRPKQPIQAEQSAHLKAEGFKLTERLGIRVVVIDHDIEAFVASEEEAEE